MSLPVVTMLQFLDEPAQLQKFFDLRGKLVTCFSVKGLTLAERIEQFERTRERIAASENAVIRFMHLEDVEITAFRAIQRSRFYLARSKLDSEETFIKLVEALPGGRLELALRDQIERVEHGRPAATGDLIPAKLIEAEFRDDPAPGLPEYRYGGKVPPDMPVMFLESYPVQPPEKPWPFRVVRNDPAPVEHDNRFGQERIDWTRRHIDSTDDPRILHANTMLARNREARGVAWGILLVLAAMAVAGLALRLARMG